MPEFAANLSMLFTERPFLERFAAAAEAGFTAVEYLFPYTHSPEDVSAALHSAGLKQALFNAPAGDWEAGERGLAALTGRDKDFDASISKALDYAQALDCRQVHVMAGITPQTQEATATYIGQIRRAADQAQAAGVKVLLEPINPVDMPGYFLSGIGKGLEIIEKIDHPNVGLQLDLYHAQITDGDLTRLIRASAGVTEHIQIASVPDRQEPDRGEVNYPWLFELLDAEGYSGYIGCEYHPAARTEDGLSWFAPYGSSQRISRYKDTDTPSAGSSA